MGNHRFKLSDMMPNAWFYKLRDMSKVRTHNPSHSHSIHKNMHSSSTPNPRKSFYYTADPIRMDTNLRVSPENCKFFDPPAKKRGKQRKTVYMPSPRKIAPSQTVWHKPSNNIHDYFESGPTSHDSADFQEPALSEFEYEDDPSHPSSCSCKLTSSATDIIIDVDIDMISEPDLPPIQTKPGKRPPISVVSLEESVLSNNKLFKSPIEKPKRDRRSSTSPGSRKSFSSGVRIGRKSRRRKGGKEEKKGVVFYSESLAIVKASFDPEKDFRESMMEMIEENNIKESKDLEELLACYLSLNSNQYHDLIIKAFEQIWFNMMK